MSEIKWHDVFLCSSQDQADSVVAQQIAGLTELEQKMLLCAVALEGWSNVNTSPRIPSGFGFGMAAISEVLGANALPQYLCQLQQYLLSEVGIGNASH